MPSNRYKLFKTQKVSKPIGVSSREERFEGMLFFCEILHYFEEQKYDKAQEKFQQEFLSLKIKYNKTTSMKENFLPFKEKWEKIAYETLPIQRFICNFQHLKFNRFFKHCKSHILM